MNKLSKNYYLGIESFIKVPKKKNHIRTMVNNLEMVPQFHEHSNIMGLLPTIG